MSRYSIEGADGHRWHVGWDEAEASYFAARAPSDLTRHDPEFYASTDASYEDAFFSAEAAGEIHERLTPQGLYNALPAGTVIPAEVVGSLAHDAPADAEQLFEAALQNAEQQRETALQDLAQLYQAAEEIPGYPDVFDTASRSLARETAAAAAVPLAVDDPVRQAMDLHGRPAPGERDPGPSQAGQHASPQPVSGAAARGTAAGEPPSTRQYASRRASARAAPAAAGPGVGQPSGQAGGRSGGRFAGRPTSRLIRGGQLGRGRTEPEQGR